MTSANSDSDLTVPPSADSAKAHSWQAKAALAAGLAVPLGLLFSADPAAAYSGGDGDNDAGGGNWATTGTASDSGRSYATDNTGGGA